MRRKDREVSKKEDIINIIDNCKVCRIAMNDQDGLYIVPLNFGYSYDDNGMELYFHSAREGRKVSALKNNKKVCFEMDCEHKLIKGDIACKYGYSYKSIIGNGEVVFIENIEERKRALSLLMKHQTGEDFIFEDRMVKIVEVFKVIVEDYTAKCHE